MHEKRGNFCIFLLKIAEKEGKTDQREGWELPRGWIEDVPRKGFIELVYFTSAKQVRIDCRRSLIPRCLVSEETDLSELADPFSLLKVKEKLADAPKKGQALSSLGDDAGAKKKTPAGARPPSAAALKGLAAKVKVKRASDEEKTAESNE
jgi:hypothetical protein